MDWQRSGDPIDELVYVWVSDRIRLYNYTERMDQSDASSHVTTYCLTTTREHISSTSLRIVGLPFGWSSSAR